MKHEYRCIEIPCTCVSILRDELEQIKKENAAMKKKIDDFLSCCCSGCQRHNTFILEDNHGTETI